MTENAAKEWADVRLGQRWRSRDKRDCGLAAEVIDIGQDHVIVKRFRLARVSKRLFHRLYEGPIQ